MRDDDPAAKDVVYPKNDGPSIVDKCGASWEDNQMSVLVPGMLVGAFQKRLGGHSGNRKRGVFAESVSAHEILPLFRPDVDGAVEKGPPLAVHKNRWSPASRLSVFPIFVDVFGSVNIPGAQLSVQGNHFVRERVVDHVRIIVVGKIQPVFLVPIVQQALRTILTVYWIEAQKHPHLFVQLEERLMAVGFVVDERATRQPNLVTDSQSAWILDVFVSVRLRERQRVPVSNNEIPRDRKHLDVVEILFPSEIGRRNP